MDRLRGRAAAHQGQSAQVSFSQTNKHRSLYCDASHVSHGRPDSGVQSCRRRPGHFVRRDEGRRRCDGRRRTSAAHHCNSAPSRRDETIAASHHRSSSARRTATQCSNAERWGGAAAGARPRPAASDGMFTARVSTRAYVPAASPNNHGQRTTHHRRAISTDAPATATSVATTTAHLARVPSAFLVAA